MEEAPAALVVSDILPAPPPRPAAAAGKKTAVVQRERERKRKRDSGGREGSRRSTRSSGSGSNINISINNDDKDEDNGHIKYMKGMEGVEDVVDGQDDEDRATGEGEGEGKVGVGEEGSRSTSASFAPMSPSHSSSSSSALMDGLQDLAADVEALRGVGTNPKGITSAPARPFAPVGASTERAPAPRIMETPVPIPVPLVPRLSTGLLSAPTAGSTKSPTQLPGSTPSNPLSALLDDWHKRDAARQLLQEAEDFMASLNAKTHHAPRPITATARSIDKHGGGGGGFDNIETREKYEEEEEEDEGVETEEVSEGEEDQSDASLDSSEPKFLTADELLEMKKKEFLQHARPSSPDVPENFPAVDDSMQVDEPKRDGEVKYTRLEADRKGRSYYLFKDTDGTSKPTSNAPFPPGHWRFPHPDGSEPIICPVRDCRALSPNMKSASSHFHGGHNRRLFNDNGDGTFSAIGTYSAKKNSSPGIVVSHDPLPPDALPPAEPDYPSSRRKELNEAAAAAAAMSSSSPAETPGAFRTRDGRRASEATRLSLPTSTGGIMPDRAAKRLRVSVGSASGLPSTSVTPVNPPLTSQGGKMLTSEPLRYLHSFLSPKQEVPDRVEVRALARFKKVRGLPSSWISVHRNTIMEPPLYACSLAYIVGEELVGAKACRRRPNSRLSERCVILPSGMLVAERIAFSVRPTCISCRYSAIQVKQGTDCLWGQMQMLEREAAADRPDLGGQDEADVPGEAWMEAIKAAQQQAEALSNGVTSSVNGARAETSLPMAREDTEAPASRRSAGSLSMNVGGEVAREAKSDPEARPEQPLAVTYRAPPIEMEDWEIAPGTIRSDLTGEQMAFSTGYLSTMHPIRVSPDVSLNVSLIKPGTTYHWPAQGDQLRTCFVGSGKLLVKIDGQAFRVGTNGAFIIKPNQSCSAENRMYVEAAVCCNTIQGYELTGPGME